ncbi:CCHC-type domain-containing protein [Trichonephila clavipes]|nr:CCHC-type domain-containing protein [Trichonephila clavipes]
MPTEQEAKPAVVTPSLQQWRSPSTFRGAPGEDPLKWLKEYDRVANFNKWDDMMCLANVYFFLDGTRRWYVNNEDADSWEAFKSYEEIVQDEVERVLAPVSTKPTETRPRPTYAAVTGKCNSCSEIPEPRKTDVWRTADNRPVCFHCGRPGHVMLLPREKAVFDNSRNRRRNFDDVGTEEKYADQTLLAVLRQSPREAPIPIRRYRSPSPYRRSSQSPGRRARGKLRSDLQGVTNRETSYPNYSGNFLGFSRRPTSRQPQRRDVKHRIFTGDHAPINQRAYRVSPTERRIIHEEIQKMLDEGIVQPSESPWSSPIVLVRKKDGSWRFASIIAKLNSVTKKDVYPLPRIDDTLDCLKGAMFFSFHGSPIWLLANRNRRSGS